MAHKSGDAHLSEAPQADVINLVDKKWLAVGSPTIPHLPLPQPVYMVVGLYIDRYIMAT